MIRPPFPTREDLIKGWIDRYVTEIANDGHWPGSLLDEIVTDYPEEGWIIIIELMDRTQQGSKSDGVLAAGALEDLLVRHGAQFIERIEEKALQSERFRYLLSGVWRNSIPDDIWSRVHTAVQK